MRTTITTVTIKKPFLLAGITGKQPAGNYEIELGEQLINDTAFLAYRRMSTQIHVSPDGAGSGVAQLVPIDPVELEALLATRRIADAPAVRADPDYLIVS